MAYGLLPPKRHRSALLLAWLFTLTAVGLAVGPNAAGAYDAQLAIYTATLIALIWYTYFTYRAVNAYTLTIVRTGLSGKVAVNAIVLTPHVENDSPNRADVRIRLEVWIDSLAYPMDEFYSAAISLPLDPRSGFDGAVRLDGPPFPAPTTTPPPYNEPAAAYRQCRVRLTVYWRDQYGETGLTGPRHFRAQPIGDPKFQPIVTKPEVARWFADLPASPSAPQVPWEP